MENHKGFTLLIAHLTKVLLIFVFILLTACGEKGHTKKIPSMGVAADSCLLVESGWVREVIPGQNITAGYPELQNVCDVDITITGVDSSDAKAVEIHQHKHNGAMLRMVKRIELIIKAKEVLTFSPGDLHLMIFNPVFHQSYFSFNVIYQYDNQIKKISAILPIKNLNEQTDNHHEK